MKNSIVVPFGADKVRMVEIEGEPWFALKDVCEIFGETNYRRVANRLDEDEKGVSQIDTPGGKQKMTVINEVGLYSALFAMQPEKARGVDDEYIAKRQAQLKRFKRWVTHEVLPSIRKYGFYECARTELTEHELVHIRNKAWRSELYYRQNAREKFKKEYYTAWVFKFHSVKKSDVEQAIEARRDLQMLQIYDDERYVQYDRDCIRLSKYGLESLRRFKAVPLGNEFEMLEADIAAHNEKYFIEVYTKRALNGLRQIAERRFQIEG